MSEQEKKFLPEVEVAVSKLPSRGIPYPESATLKYQTYTFGEVKKASTSQLGLVDSLELVLSGITASFDTDKLTLSDALYLGVLRKISSMGGVAFEMPFVCKKCKKQSKSRFDQNMLEFADLDADVTELPLAATLAGKEMEFAPITVREFIDLKKGKYGELLENGKPDTMAMYALLCKNLKFKDAFKILNTELKDPNEMEVMDELDTLLAHSLKPLKAECKEKGEDKKSCGYINFIKLEGREALLRPFRVGKGSARSRIRIGKASES